MDKNHRLDAPHNDDLSVIEQIGDRSGLSAVYHHAHSEWEGVELMSGEARAKQHAEEQARITKAIRKWFPVIGFLIPLPVLLFLLMSAAGGTYLHLEMSTFLIIPIFFGTGLWLYLSYASLRTVFKIFYDHSIKTLPYLIAHLILLGLAFKGVFTWAQQYHTGWAVGDVLIVGGIVSLASIILSGILLPIWTARRLSGSIKLGAIGFLALLLLALTIYASII